MAVPFLAAVEHAENESLFTGIVDQIGDHPRMPEKANPQAWQDLVDEKSAPIRNSLSISFECAAD